MLDNEKKNVLFLMLGDRFEGEFGPARWKSWRGSIELCRHPSFNVDKVVIIHSERTHAMGRLLRSDIGRVKPGIERQLLFLPLRDKHNVRQLFWRNLELLRSYALDYEHERYFIRLVPGAAYTSILGVVLLITSGYWHSSLISLDPPIPGEPPEGIVRIFNPDIGLWLRMAAKERRKRLDAASYLKAGIRTRNLQYNKLLVRLERVVLNTVAPILIFGPTGSGKTVLARRIYDLKKKSAQISGDFVAVNCSTLSGDMALSALFGHVRGSFTGATASREGHLRMAHEGILFLDEIGDLPMDCQARLLTALESHQFYPVGSDTTVSSNFQLICCTNKELRREVAAGRFREDLLGRINLWSFQLPPLCARKEDVEPNLSYELERIASVLNRKIEFEPPAEKLFLEYATSDEALWPGNFRELSASVERMATFEESGMIGVHVVEEEWAHLQRDWQGEELAEAAGSAPRSLLTAKAPSFPLLRATLDPETEKATDLFDKIQLEGVLAVCKSSESRSEAGRRLFASSRQRKASSNDTDRLTKYLRKFGLSWDTVRGG